MNPLLTPRDWQIEATARAAKLSGTPDGRQALVEARRYEMLAEEIERLRPWYDAMDEAMVTAYLGIADPQANPRDVLHKIIDWHTMVALDPAVSKDAQDLIDLGRNTERPKDHEIAQLVNALVVIARLYGNAQQLRDRISAIVVPAIKGSFPKSIVNAYAPRVEAP